MVAACGGGPSPATGATIPQPPSAVPPGSAMRGSATFPAPGATRPCGTAAAGGRVDHVVWILMENRAATDVVGSPAAPYLASVARACGMATGYAGVAHPSLPNYIALTSGSTHGISNDGGPLAHPLAGPSIFSLLGDRWRSWEEAMPSPCDRRSSGDYAVKHDPAAYYTDLGARCPAQDLALPGVPDPTAAFTFLTPDLCHDMHDCSTHTGDAWLSAEVPRILGSRTYRAGHTAVFITWDENDSGGSKVPCYVIAPSVRPGTVVPAAFTHYSLLRTTEELLGLRPLLAGAATAPSMAAAFGL